MRSWRGGGGGRSLLPARVLAMVLLATTAACAPVAPSSQTGAGEAREGSPGVAGGGRAFEPRQVQPDQAAAELTGSPGYRSIVFFWPGDSLRAERVIRTLEGAPDLPGLPAGIPSGVHIVLAPTEVLFDSVTGGRIPEWGAGVAIPSLDRIVLPIYAAPRTRGWDEAGVIRHEWAHLGLHQAGDGLRAPRWFDEGYAEWASGAWTAEEGWRLRVAMASGRLPPLDSLALAWPRDRASAELAYLLAASAVEYLVDRSGERGIEVLIQRWQELESFEGAIRVTYGLTGSQLEEAWRGFIRSRYGWLTVLSRSLVFWGLAGAALAVLFFIRRRRDRERLARLRAAEPPDAPAWWMDEEGVPPGFDEGPEGPPPEWVDRIRGVD